MIWPFVGIALGAAGYQFLSLVAALRFLRRRDARPANPQPVSVLKPVCGLDPHFYEAIRSNARQDYPVYELLFGVSDPRDPAIAEIRRLQQECPEVPVRLVVSPRRAPNPKVAVLEELAAAARHPILVVNDSDIEVPPDYLSRVVAPLKDPEVGLVTCLYRGQADRVPGRLEALGIATEFVPGALVAPLVGVSEFALGATLAFRADDLQRIGGFQAVRDYLADDYQLSRRIRALGLKVVVGGPVVTTYLPEFGWRAAWQHQVRWARTIRVSRRGGYLGMPVTWATVWALLLAACGQMRWAALLFALRLTAGLVVALGVLGMPCRILDVALLPLRDLWGAAVWVAGLSGRTVVWRGRRLRIRRDGRILDAEASVTAH